MVRVGVIGVGYWGPNLVRTLNEVEGVHVARVADLDPARRAFIARRFPAVETTPNAGDVIGDHSIDAVFVATPPATHYSLASDALSACKHVFVEKPLTTNVAHAEHLVQFARAKAKILAVGHLFLYHPAVTAIRDLIAGGDLGDVFYLCSSRFNVGPPQTKVDVLWDLAPHDVAIALALMGESAIRVTATGTQFQNKEFVETAYLNLLFPGGRMAQINVGWLTPVKTRNLMLVCAQKTVVYDDVESVEKIRIYEAARDNRDIQDGRSASLAYGPGSIVIPPLAASQPLKLECENFVNSILTGNEPFSNGERAIEVVRILETAARSIYSGLVTDIRSVTA